MYCKKCGAQIKEGAKFCGSCGTAVSATVDSDKDAIATAAAPTVAVVPNSLVASCADAGVIEIASQTGCGTPDSARSMITYHEKKDFSNKLKGAIEQTQQSIAACDAEIDWFNGVKYTAIVIAIIAVVGLIAMTMNPPSESAVQDQAVVQASNTETPHGFADVAVAVAGAVVGLCIIGLVGFLSAYGFAYFIEKRRNRESTWFFFSTNIYVLCIMLAILSLFIVIIPLVGMVYLVKGISRKKRALEFREQLQNQMQDLMRQKKQVEREIAALYR